MRAYLTTYLGPVPVLCWLPEHKPPSCDGVGLVISCKGYVQLGARSCPLSPFALCPLPFALYPLHNYQAGMGLPAWRADLITPIELDTACPMLNHSKTLSTPVNVKYKVKYKSTVCDYILCVQSLGSHGMQLQQLGSISRAVWVAT